MSPPPRSIVGRARDTAWRARRTADVLRRPPSGTADRERLEAALDIIRQVAARVLPDYVVGDYGRSWQTDRKFLDRLEQLEPHGRRSAERKFALAQLAKLVADVPGDTAELGVYRGASSWFICDATQPGDRTHWAVDSFAGLSQPGGTDGDYWRAGDLSTSEAQAVEVLTPFRANIVQGWIPEALDAVLAERLALTHIDVDLYEPTLASFAFAYERTSPGGILVCDDYGFETCPGARRAVDEFMENRAEPVVELPTGQGLVIRHSSH